MDTGATWTKVSAGLGANPELAGLLRFRTSTYLYHVPVENKTNVSGNKTNVSGNKTESLICKKIPLHG